MLTVLFSISLLLVSAGCSKNIVSNIIPEAPISTSNEQTEYEAFDGVDVQSSITVPTTTEPTTKAYHDVDKYMYTTETVNIREEDNTDCEVIDKVSQFNKVKAVETNGDWYSVITDDNVEGYVSAKYLKDLGDTFVEVDISDQTLYLYVDDKMDHEAPVVTGKKGVHDTRLGCNPIYLHNEEKPGKLLKGEDYEDGVWVDRWMPFDGGIGLHDASWRSDFSSDAYLNGSHGCVNMRFEDADYVFDRVDVGTNVLVHK